MNLPNPSPAYDAGNESQARRAIMEEDERNRKVDQEIDMGRERFIIRSPNGHRWVQTISNLGVVTWTDLDP